MSTTLLQQLRSGELAKQAHLVTEIRLTNCQLESFPEELYAFVDSLRLLDLSGNQLTQLPDDLERFHQLTILFCSNNPFTKLPRALGQCPKLQMIGFKANQLVEVPEDSLPTATLRWLILTDNRLQQLPNTLAQCLQLQKLMLAGNQLRDLPDLASCKSLELIRLASNQLDSLPPWLRQLPQLAWLAISANPFTQAKEQSFQQQHPLLQIHFDTLRLGKRLGEGASGITYAALSDQFPNQALALKLFKHSMTSDGAPENELLAHQSVGQHPHLTHVLASVYGQQSHEKQETHATPPDTQFTTWDGMLMTQLPTHLQILAAPPSLESCSRDVYDASLRLSIAHFKQIVLGVVQAVQHMHQSGWLHGDVYAHNILWSDSEVILSDFGAASVIPEHADWIRRIEYRAIGVLTSELIQHTPALDSTQKEQLLDMAKQLQHADLECIPTLSTLKEHFESM